MKLGSKPIEIEFEADNPEENVIIKDRNPNIYFFGRISFSNGQLIGYTYYGRDFAVLKFSRTPLAENSLMYIDSRRRKEVNALITKIGYYQALSHERKLKYLRNHGVFANCNSIVGESKND